MLFLTRKTQLSKRISREDQILPEILQIRVIMCCREARLSEDPKGYNPRGREASSRNTTQVKSPHGTNHSAIPVRQGFVPIRSSLIRG